MKSLRHDPLRLDVAAFAADAGVLSGVWPGASLPRLADLQVPPQDVGQADVQWQAQGERQARPGSEAELWLALSAQAPVWLTCQRCLLPMPVDLALDRRLRFVAGEAQAEALDADSDDDVLALSRSLDLRELVEDELLLGLPLVPRHTACPTPLPVPIRLEDEADALSDGPADGDRLDMPALDEAADDSLRPDGRPNPFAVLRQLKKGGSGG